MAVKQNAIELAHMFPLAADAVHKSFYVDDGLDVETTITLQRQLQDLFTRGGFMLRKWNSIASHLYCRLFSQSCKFTPFLIQNMAAPKHWDTATYIFCITTSKFSSSDGFTCSHPFCGTKKQ